MRFQRSLRIGTIAIACAALLLGACSESFDGTGPNQGPGQLTVTVSTAGAPGAAFEVMVIGAGISNPVVASAGDLLYSFASNDTVKVALIGEHSSGPLFKFSVPDVSQAASYTTSLLSVAGTDNAMLASGSFSLTTSN